MDFGEPKITVEIITKVDDELRDIMLGIDEEAFGSGSLTEWTLPLFLNYGRIYLARYNGKPVGVAELIRDWRDPDLAYMYGYAIDEEYRGYGFGTSLLRAILENLPRAGFRRLQIIVHPENQIAIHLCQEKFRMKKVEFIKNYYGYGEDRLLMEWKAEINET